MWTRKIDGDEDNDVALSFSIAGSGIACGDTEAMLSGETYAGDAFGGKDTVSTPACDTGGCHP